MAQKGFQPSAAHPSVFKKIAVSSENLSKVSSDSSDISQFTAILLLLVFGDLTLLLREFFGFCISVCLS